MLLPCLLLIAAPQVVPDAGATEARDPVCRVELEACAPGGDRSLRWSPKGAKLALRDAGDGVLETVLELGGESPRAVRLERSPGSEHQDRLLIDLDGDGEFGADEELGCTPSERRGKWWSSFAATVALSVPPSTVDGEPGQRAYPINLWYVFDPVEPEAAPALRFSRRGWHQGQVEVDGAPVVVQINDYVMDGRFTRGDAWRIGRDVADVLAPPVRTLERHDWLDGQAWRVVELDPHGRFVTITRFDPGVSEAEERAAEDRYAADRSAPRAPQPLAFRHDVDAALAAAQASGSRVLLDFETSWCGPCKQMDQMVYTAQAVVGAAQGMVCIKVDGDVRRDLVQRFGVRGYPTLVVLGADGAELRRAVGYQSVAATATLLRRDDG